MKDRSGVAVIAVAVAALGGAVMTSRHVQAEDQAVYINSSGGAFDEVNRKVFWDPFTQATGIKVISSAPVDGAKLKAMVTTGNVEWDIANIDGNVLLPYVRQGLLTKLDLSKLPTSDLLKEAVTNYSILTTWCRRCSSYSRLQCSPEPRDSACEESRVAQNGGHMTSN